MSSAAVMIGVKRVKEVTRLGKPWADESFLIWIKNLFECQTVYADVHCPILVLTKTSASPLCKAVLGNSSQNNLCNTFHCTQFIETY